jgi:hypothetical protein
VFQGPDEGSWTGSANVQWGYSGEATLLPQAYIYSNFTLPAAVYKIRIDAAYIFQYAPDVADILQIEIFDSGNNLIYQSPVTRVSKMVTSIEFSVSILVGGTYRVFINNTSAYFGDLNIKQVCWTKTGETTPPTFAATGTLAPTNTPTPSLTPTPWSGGDVGTPGPEPTVCCSGGAPSFPSASGNCGTLSLLDWLNIAKVLAKLLCELFDLISRALRWLGRFIQWLLCPVNDFFAWLQCLASLIATIAYNLICIIRQPFEFVIYLWRALLAEVAI